MARFINIDQDYIFIGDIYKNFQIFKKKDQMELADEKLIDQDIIALKKRFSSKIDSHCIGAWPFSQGEIQELKH